MRVRTTIVIRTILAYNLTPFICLFILILMLSGFLTLIVIMIQNLAKGQFIHISPAIVFIQSNKSLTPQPMFSPRVKNIDKLLTQKVKRDIAPSSTVKWDSLNAGTMNKPRIKNNKSNHYSRLNIGKLQEVDLLSMMKAVLIMTISSKTFKLVFDSYSKTSIINLRLQSQLIPLAILNPLQPFWLTQEFKAILLNDPMNTFSSKTKLNLFGKLYQLMEIFMELYRLTSDGLFMGSKINSDQDLLVKKFAKPKYPIFPT